MYRFLILISLLTSQLCSAQWVCGDTLIDPRDGKMYVTVPIGSDCWMAENLNYGQFVLSDSTSTVHSDMFNDGNVQKYCNGNDSMNCVTYGGLYEWTELMNYNSGDAHGICPPGWHVATNTEWMDMIVASGGTFSGNRGTGANDLKAIGEGVGADTGTNASGFNAKAHGDRDAFGIFYGLNLRFIFWTSTTSSFMPYQYTLWAENDSIYQYNDAGTESGFSCRCVKDAPTIIEELPLADKLNVFPDPATTSFTIRIPGHSGVSNYTVYDAQGKIVQTGSFEGEEVLVDGIQLQPGYYILSVFSDGETCNRQLIIAE